MVDSYLSMSFSLTVWSVLITFTAIANGRMNKETNYILKMASLQSVFYFLAGFGMKYFL